MTIDLYRKKCEEIASAIAEESVNGIDTPDFAPYNFKKQALIEDFIETIGHRKIEDILLKVLMQKLNVETIKRVGDACIIRRVI